MAGTAAPPLAYAVLAANRAAPPALRFERAVPGDHPAGYLAAGEAGPGDLVPGTEKLIVWHAGAGHLSRGNARGTCVVR